MQPNNKNSIFIIEQKKNLIFLFYSFQSTKMGDDMLVVRIVVPHEDMMTKAMRFSTSKTIREVLFETAQNLCGAGIEIPDVINFNLKFEPGKKKNKQIKRISSTNLLQRTKSLKLRVQEKVREQVLSKNQQNLLH